MRKREEDQEKQFFISLYEKYARAMYRIAFSILKNESQSEDVVQDSFIKLMRYLEKMNGMEEIQCKVLISRITKNEAVNRYRKNQRESSFFDKGVDTAVTSDKLDKLPSIQSAEERQYIRQLIAQLDDKSKEIIQYRCFYELEYQEIASILEISEQAAAKRFERAKKLIKNMRGDE
ncbi:MAG: sigma-70 family RNA polymerase sigma factor [Hespellia sp.]|nr:sigma-70 family RNA polymerase sigma factor [Hespellia sp.]